MLFMSSERRFRFLSFTLEPEPVRFGVLFSAAVFYVVLCVRLIVYRFSPNILLFLCIYKKKKVKTKSCSHHPPLFRALLAPKF